MVLAAYGHALMLAWRLDESRAACGEALAVAAAIGDERPALRARAVLGMSLYLLGFADDGTACLHDARQLARENGLVRDELRAQVLLSDVLLMQGRLAEAVKEALHGLALSRQHGYERSSGVVLGANAAEALLLLGDWSRAEEVLETTMLCTGGFRPEGVHIVCAQLELGRGQLRLAREHLELGARAGDEPQSRAAYAAISAELALWEGRFDDAIELVDRALALGERCDLQIREHRICALGLWAEAERVSDATVRRETATVERSQRHADELLKRARRSASRAANMASEASGWLAVAEAEHSRVAGMPSPDQLASRSRGLGQAGKTVLGGILPMAPGRGTARVGRTTIRSNGAGARSASDGQPPTGSPAAECGRAACTAWPSRSRRLRHASAP